MANAMLREVVALDGSVAISWLFHDERNAYADSILTRLPNLELVVPSLWHLEIANVLLVGERRHRSTLSDTVNWLGFLAALPIRVDPDTFQRAWTGIMALARAQNLSVYDAAYLELAQREGIPLATLDSQLLAATQAVGVALYQPTP